MTDTKKTTSSPDMDSWQMATSVLIGLWQAIDKARAEHAELLSAHYGKPYAPGVSRVSAILETLMETEQVLHTKLSRTARSSNLPFPERVRW